MLGLVTSEFLYRKHPNEHEGQLTKTKSLLVSKAILSRRALAMGLGKYVLMSSSESESGGRQRLSILADAFESVIGAVYLDQGFETARAFIIQWLLSDTQEIVADKRHTNYKSHLQEYVQSTFRTHPVYRIRSEMGPDHSKQFNVEVLVGRRLLGTGRGRNKKEAEQAAARNALEQVETGPKTDAVRPAARTPQPPAAPAASVAPAVPERESDDEGARRRRGRRGGRGRRREEEVSEAGSSRSAPAHDRPADRPRAERTPESSPVLQAPRNSVPAAGRFEDELDDEGRPEGLLEERRVDTHAWGREADEGSGSETSSEPMMRGTGGRSVERLSSYAQEPSRTVPIRGGESKRDEPDEMDEPQAPSPADESRGSGRDEPWSRAPREEAPWERAPRDEPQAPVSEPDEPRDEMRREEPPAGAVSGPDTPDAGRVFGRRPGRSPGRSRR